MFDDLTLKRQDERRLSPLRGFFQIGCRGALGLTPQAMYLSPLRGSIAHNVRLTLAGSRLIADIVRPTMAEARLIAHNVLLSLAGARLMADIVRLTLAGSRLMTLDARLNSFDP